MMKKEEKKDKRPISGMKRDITTYLRESKINK